MSQPKNSENESEQMLNDMASALYERCCQIAFAGELAAKMDALPVGAVLDVTVEDLRKLGNGEISVLLNARDHLVTAKLSIEGIA